MQLNTYVSVSSLWLTEKNIIEFSIWNGHKTSNFRGSIFPFFCFHLLVHWSMCSEILWLKSLYLPVWPDLAINWTLGNFSKPLATINSLAIFVKVSKSLIVLVKSFLGNFLLVTLFTMACLINVHKCVSFYKRKLQSRCVFEAVIIEIDAKY